MSQAFYSPIDRLAEQMPRTKGTGAEFLTELSKRPGYKPVEAEDRNLQTLAALPKMERAQFLEALKAKKAVVPDVETRMGGDTAHDEYTLPGGKNYREILLNHPNPAEGGFPGVPIHFNGAPNVLASIMAKDRVGPNGEKILHLEEIQSDWHQQGRKKGYVPRGVDLDKEERLRYNEWLGLQRKMKEAAAASNMIDRDLASDKPLFQDPARRAHMEQRRVEHNNAIMDLFPQVARAEETHRQAAQKAMTSVSDAPYKKNWHELALKKMIHHAAERGYTHLAITPGEEVAKRYGLNKHLDALSYRPNQDEGTGLLEGWKGQDRLMGINVKPEELGAHVGESVAKSLLSQPAQQGRHFLRGQDLNIGGEGMKGFYDKMVPDFLNKFGKKYGAQVGTINPGIMAEEPKFNPDTGKDVYHDVPLHSFPITPEMRKDVLENGLPLYAEGGSVKYSVRDDKGTEHPCNDFSHARNKAGSMISYKKTAEAHILEDGVPKWHWALGKTLTPVGHAKGGPVEEDVPRETVKAYKLFRVHKDHPGKLFPLFIGKHDPVEMNKWVPAEHIPTKGFAERPGWHAGDLPMATHIGEKSSNELTAPDTRPHNQVWTEIEMPNDVDWQTEANKRGTNKHGRVVPVNAHITDQVPTGGHYRYKTNPNMTGSWLIGGAMKVNKVLSDKEVKAINRAAKVSDLPRQQPFDRKAFGLATGGTISLDQMRHELNQHKKAK